MHVALVADHDPFVEPGHPDHGGRTEHVRGLAGALAERGHRVGVWTRRAAREAVDGEARPGVTVSYVPAGAATPLPADQLVARIPLLARRLAAAWRAEPPDLVHAHGWMSGLVTSSVARHLGLPFVQSFHGPAGPGGGTRASAEAVVAARAGAVLGLGEDELLRLARLGVPRRKARLLPFGVDVEEFAPDGPALRRAEHRRLVAVGRLDEESGIDDIVVALRSVPGVELFVAGGTAGRRGGPELLRVHQLARRAGVASRVRLIGPVAREHLPALYRSADAVVHVPRRATFGTVVLEAMACSRAVVASAVGCQRETVVDDVTGLLVPPGRPDELGHALRRLLDETAMLSAYGIAGRDRVMARYAWGRIAAQADAVYQEVAAGANRAEPEPAPVLEDAEQPVR